MAPPRISIVVPVLDEEDSLERYLPAVVETDSEVIAVDGGSRDRTAEVAARLGATLVDSPPGRGVQLNRGAAAATGDVLLFLHADTTLPDNALRSIAAAIEGGHVGGGFAVRFHSERPIFALGSKVVNLRTRLTGVPLGDQAQFARRDAFEAIGGFEDWPILEDLAFARRLKRYGPTILIPDPVETSPRRFEKRGITRTIVTNWLIWALFFLGVAPRRLAKLYRQVR